MVVASKLAIQIWPQCCRAASVFRKREKFPRASSSKRSLRENAYLYSPGVVKNSFGNLARKRKTCARAASSDFQKSLLSETATGAAAAAASCVIWRR